MEQAIVCDLVKKTTKFLNEDISDGLFQEAINLILNIH